MNKLQQRMAENGYVRSNEALIRLYVEQALAKSDWDELVKYDGEKWNGKIFEPLILTEKQKQDMDEYIKTNNLPF